MCFQELFCLCEGLEKKKADKEYVAMEVDVVSWRMWGNKSKQLELHNNQSREHSNLLL